MAKAACKVCCGRGTLICFRVWVRVGGEFSVGEGNVGGYFIKAMGP
jgi:hypothetical protein